MTEELHFVGDRDHGSMLLARVEEAVDQVDDTGAGGTEDGHGLAGQIRVRNRCERSPLLVTNVDKVDLAIAAQSVYYRIKRVADNADNV